MQQRFLLQILLLAQHVSGTTMPIIRSSRVLYSGCCLWYLVLWLSSCWSGVELRVMCLVCRMLQILLLAQHVSGTTMPIIRGSRVLYSGYCLWYFVLWFSSCCSGVELRVMCPVCRMLVKQILSKIGTYRLILNKIPNKNYRIFSTLTRTSF